MWPYTGDTARVFGDGEKLMTERFKQHGPAFTTWILGKRTTVVGSLDMMKMLLNMEHDLVEGAFSDRASIDLSQRQRHPLGCCCKARGKACFVCYIRAQYDRFVSSALLEG